MRLLVLFTRNFIIPFIIQSLHVNSSAFVNKIPYFLLGAVKIVPLKLIFLINLPRNILICIKIILQCSSRLQTTQNSATNDYCCVLPCLSQTSSSIVSQGGLYIYPAPVSLSVYTYIYVRIYNFIRFSWRLLYSTSGTKKPRDQCASFIISDDGSGNMVAVWQLATGHLINYSFKFIY